MSPNEARLVRNTALAILALVALRLAAAAWTPLTFDEAYYWMWSKHLAGGYYDHPPGVALVIRLGTMIAGDTELGVRLVSILLALPMSWALYRAASILFGGIEVAATAAILLNVTLMAAVGTLIVTPDSPLLVAASFVLFFLAKVLETGRGAWWLAVGAAVGAALLSKYTSLFFGPAILIWLVAVPKLRRWLISPWPYLGGLVSLLIFSPVILWNADHQWVSFIKQIGRARIEDFRPAFIGELIPTQIAFATPRWDLRPQRTVDFCRRWAAPSGVLMFALLIVQANTGVLSAYRRDATVRSVGVGWGDLAGEIEAVRVRFGATCVLAPDYGTTGWLAFYLPKGTCVVQPTQRIRWVNMPEPDPAQLAGKLLYVDEARPGGRPYLNEMFARVERVAEFTRKRGPLTIETYALDLLEDPKGDVLDRSPPPELE